MGVFFRTTLERADQFRDWLISAAHSHAPFGALIPILYGALGAGVGGWLVQKAAPEAKGSGIPHLKAVLYRLQGMRWGRILVVKFLGGAVSIGSGLALGREGPIIQMGGAIGQMTLHCYLLLGDLNVRLRTDRREATQYIAVQGFVFGVPTLAA